MLVARLRLDFTIGFQAFVQITATGYVT
jgi:hypothetical protein